MSVVALGTFDGVHKGHKHLIETALRVGREIGEEVVIYTFKNHPRAIYAKEPALLMSAADRLEALKGFGCSVVADDFDMELSRMSAEAFAGMLCERFDMHVAVAGFNYSFGYKGSGNMRMLSDMGSSMGFTIREIPALLVEGEPASSTRVRRAIQEGDISLANAILAEPWTVKGIVREGKKNGHKFGFPTANLDFDPVLVMPKHGVYATFVRIGDEEYQAATNVGTNPTVGGMKVTIEPHILDFSRNIYGEKIEIRFIAQQRGEICFETVEELSAQIGRDARDARKILKDWQNCCLQVKNAVI